MKRYGYHRTSTKEQHLDRGITEINEYCKSNNLELEKIFTDQQTGKNFNRPRYTIMKEDVLREGDELIITEVDRLGKNKRETLKELQYYRDNGIRVGIYASVSNDFKKSAYDTILSRISINARHIRKGGFLFMGKIEKVIREKTNGAEKILLK